MELFAPDNLPGVGMGDIGAIVSVAGLIGLAVTSGMLLATGLAGAALYIAAAVLVLAANDEQWGGQPVVAAVVLAVVAVLAFVRQPGGRLWAVWPAAVVAGAAVGYAWAEWNEGVFGVPDAEAWLAIALGIAGAAVGAWAASLFVQGSVRAGGSLAIVGTVVALVALALNAASFYVPFAGYVVLVLAALLAVRLRGRRAEKYHGLRILS